MGNAVTIRGGTAYLLDPRTGQLGMNLSAHNPIAAASDGDIIVIVEGSGNIRRFDATNGQGLGNIIVADVKSCNITGGVILVTHGNGGGSRFDARTGMGLGRS